MKTNTLLLPIIALVACLQSSAVIGMEAPTEKPNVQLIRRTASAESLHSEEYNRTQALLALAKKAPQAPAYKAAAKKVNPPAPEKPQSFYAKNKKALVMGGIVTASAVVASAVWHFTKGETEPQVIRYGLSASVKK